VVVEVGDGGAVTGDGGGGVVVVGGGRVEATVGTVTVHGEGSELEGCVLGDPVALFRGEIEKHVTPMVRAMTMGMMRRMEASS